MAKNELEDFTELIDDLVKAIYYQVKKDDGFTLFMTDTQTKEYKFTNKSNNNFSNGGVSFTAHQSFDKELIVDLTVHLNSEMKYDRAYLSIKEDYPDGVFISSNLLSGFDNKTHLYITSIENKNLDELGEYMYNEYVYPNVIMRQGDLKRLINEISPSYDRERKINDILNGENTKSED